MLALISYWHLYRCSVISGPCACARLAQVFKLPHRLTIELKLCEIKVSVIAVKIPLRLTPIRVTVNPKLVL